MQAEKEAGTANEHAGTWFSNPGVEQKPQTGGTKVGRYLNTAVEPQTVATEQSAGTRPPKKQKQAAFSNFDAW